MLKIKSSSQITEFAKKHGIARTRIIKLLPLTQLGPKVLRHALAGTLPSTITLDDLLTASMQLDWDRQTAELGINAATIDQHNVRSAG